jgi:hypothetical protein
MEKSIIDFIIASPSGTYLIVLLAMFITICVVTAIVQKVHSHLGSFSHTSRSFLLEMNPFIRLG